MNPFSTEKMRLEWYPANNSSCCLSLFLISDFIWWTLIQYNLKSKFDTIYVQLLIRHAMTLIQSTEVPKCNGNLH